MEIIDELEQGLPRGPYAGSLGYFSLSGAADMAVVSSQRCLNAFREASTA